MKRQSSETHRVFGAPALAVLSCALALLAAQPAMQGVRGPSKAVAAAVKEHASVPVLAQSAAPALQDRREVARVGVRDEALRGTGRQIHILATLEMVQRWLTQDLRPLHPLVLPALAFAPVCLLTLEPPLACAQRGITRQNPLPCPVERQFAIAQRLLAPPVV